MGERSTAGANRQIHDRQPFQPKTLSNQAQGFIAFGVSLLLGGSAILLAMSLRVSHLPELHAGKPVGDDVQRDYVAMPGLRRAKRIRQPVTPPRAGKPAGSSIPAYRKASVDIA
ncbi:MAG: hypothetical protein AMJ54_16435 [Deltaproteobacteria bacterium SG8_13]|nr:MAG: hypothetical protein AMJ54_16435 [Deltaproteobacteria bacterium SG8_13]